MVIQLAFPFALPKLIPECRVDQWAIEWCPDVDSYLKDNYGKVQPTKSFLRERRSL